MRTLLAALMLAATPAAAAPMSASEAADTVSTENMRCAASYAAGLRCAGDRLDAATARDFRRARDLTLTRAYAFGRKAGLSDETLLTRTDQARQAVTAAMRGDCANLSAVLARYGQSCKALVRDPEARLRRLTTQGP
jgi:hypothetical protein